MKNLLLLLLLSAATSNGADSGYKPSVVDFRIHNGQLYNVELSSKWTRLTSTRPKEEWVILAVLTNGVVAQSRWQEKQTDGARVQPKVIAIKDCVGKPVFIKNFVDAGSTWVKGDTFRSCPVIDIGTYEWEGQKIQAWDYGLPNTPENRKNGNVASK